MAQQLTIDRFDAAALVTLNRPEKRNALSVQLRLELTEAFAQLQADESVAAIGLTGAGDAFCAGMDVTEFGGDRAHRELLVESAARCFQAIGYCTRPTVALINGPAVAGGFALALLCDIRVASPAARLGFPELGRFLPPSYGAAAGALPPAVARDLCLTGRLLDAKEALALGVVSRVEDGRQALEELAAAPPTATAEVKCRILQHRAGASARRAARRRGADAPRRPARARLKPNPFPLFTGGSGRPRDDLRHVAETVRPVASLVARPQR